MKQKIKIHILIAFITNLLEGLFNIYLRFAIIPIFQKKKKRKLAVNFKRSYIYWQFKWFFIGRRETQVTSDIPTLNCC